MEVKGAKGLLPDAAGCSYPIARRAVAVRRGPVTEIELAFDVRCLAAFGGGRRRGRGRKDVAGLSASHVPNAQSLAEGRRQSYFERLAQGLASG